MTDEREWRLLKDWEPQDGDVFEDNCGFEVIVTSKTHASLSVGSPKPFDWFKTKYTLVSRANQTPRTFGELTDADGKPMFDTGEADQ